MPSRPPHPHDAPSLRSGFERLNGARVASIDGELVEYVHGPTGARHLHLHLPVDECAFLMAIRTPAPDSSGLTHVLEHLVMCGSERYPCRRAFFAMLGRTLSTTMNALTTEDCTAFHFATRSLADYENLLAVYLDAAFFPRLDPLDFDQEGCRVEIESGDGDGDGNAGIPVRRGVVLNEMRGLMTDPGAQLQQALNRSLFPASPYRFNAGGDPWTIPDLDLERLRAYHRDHFRPGNAVFLSAGTLEPAWVHARLHDRVLARIAPLEPPVAGIPVRSAVPPLGAPTRTVVRYPAIGAAAPGPFGASLGMAWRLGDTANPAEQLAATLLARCLLEQGDAPLRSALLDATGNPAAALAPGGVQTSRSRLVFQCGVHGCDPNRADAIESRVLETLDTLARDGLDGAQVAGALAQMERELRERHDPRYPFPLKLLTRLLPAALYGGEPTTALDGLTALGTLSARARSKEGVTDLVRHWLRDNPERVSVTAIPDPALARRLDLDDRALLMERFGPPRNKARERIVERSRALRRRQASPAGESCLPRLDLDEIGPPRPPPELLPLPAVPPAPGVGGGPDAEPGAGGGPDAKPGAGGGPGAEPGVGGGPDAEPSVGGGPDAEPSVGGGPDAEPGAGGGPDAEPGVGSGPGAEPGAGGGPDAEPGVGGGPGAEPGVGGSPGAEPGAGGGPDAEPDAMQHGGPGDGPRIWISRGATAGLTYVRFAVDLSDLDPDALDDVGLLGEILPESGHGHLTPTETRARLARVCDRLAVEPRLLACASGATGSTGAVAGIEHRAVLMLCARALATDEEALLEALAGARVDARFGPEASTNAAKAHARRTAELARNGHLHAERVAASHLDPWFAVAERWEGPSALPILAGAAGGTGEDGALGQRLHRVHRALAAAPFQVQIVHDGGVRDGGVRDGGVRDGGVRDGGVRDGGVRDGGDRRALEVLRDRLGHPTRPGAPDSGHSTRRSIRNSTRTSTRRSTRQSPGASCESAPRTPRAPAVGAWIIGGPVNYCARAYAAVTPDHADAGPLAVLAASLGGEFLQRAIRERGGAYGADARYCMRTGTFRMFSYRDPRLAGTLHDFDQAIATLRRQPPEGQRLEEAVLRAVRVIDRSRAFQIDAFERFLDELQGRTDEGRAALRASALRTGPEQLRAVAERYLSPDRGYTGVLAGAGRERELDRQGIRWRRL